MRRRALPLLLAVLAAAVPLAGGNAVYFASGRDASLFDQYDIDGYSLEAMPESNGVRLTVRTGPERGASRSSFSGRPLPDLPEAPGRDALVAGLTRGKESEARAAEAILGWISREVSYDPDRSLPQDPVAVFATRRAYCVGFSDLAVDLLRRAGIEAATVQGILVSAADSPGYDSDLSGVYHRWVKIFYPDRGWKFADPLSPRRRVDARYVPFCRRAWTRPADLRLNKVWEENP